VRLQLYKDGEAGFEANKILADDGKSGLGDSDWFGERECCERKESKENRVRARKHREDSLREVLVSEEVRRGRGEEDWRRPSLEAEELPAHSEASFISPCPVIVIMKHELTFLEPRLCDGGFSAS